MKTKSSLLLEAEFNVAWMHFVAATGGIINKFDPDLQSLIRSGFENGYAAGAANEARLNLQRIVDDQARQSGGVQ